MVYFLYGCMLQCEQTRPGYNALMNLYVRSKMFTDQIFSICILTTSNIKCASLFWNIYQMDVDYIVSVNISDLNSKISPTCSTAVGTRSGRDVCRRRSWREYIVDLRINTVSSTPPNIAKRITVRWYSSQRDYLKNYGMKKHFDGWQLCQDLLKDVQRNRKWKVELEGFDCPQACVRWHPKHARFLALRYLAQVQMWHQPAAKRHV